jgi:hypothetical protein
VLAKNQRKQQNKNNISSCTPASALREQWKGAKKGAVIGWKVGTTAGRYLGGPIGVLDGIQVGVAYGGANNAVKCIRSLK